MAPARAGRRGARSAPRGLSLAGSCCPAGGQLPSGRGRSRCPDGGTRRDAVSWGCTYFRAPPRPHPCLPEEQRVGAAGGEPLPAQPPRWLESQGGSETRRWPMSPTGWTCWAGGPMELTPVGESSSSSMLSVSLMPYFLKVVELERWQGWGRLVRAGGSSGWNKGHD